MKVFIVFILSLFSHLALATEISARIENSPIKPIVPLEYDRPLAELGKRLFFDRALSSDNSKSCHDCHQLGKYGADGLALSRGANNKLTPRNTPTVFNVALYRCLQVDCSIDRAKGKALIDQTNAVLQSKAVMGWGNAEKLVNSLSASGQYDEDFGRVFGERKVTFNNISLAITEYEKTLISVDSPFNLWLKGIKVNGKDAISDKAKTGFRLFQLYGCSGCHGGQTAGGMAIQALGNMFPPPEKYKGLFDDLGLYKTTKIEEDKHRFKVPSLTCAYYTAPYFHDGSVPTLKEAVELMGYMQTGKVIPEDENKALQQFIKSLCAAPADLISLENSN